MSISETHLCTNVHVSDLQRSVEFYKGVLGMNEMGRSSSSEEVASATLGYTSSPGITLKLLQIPSGGKYIKLGDAYRGITVNAADADFVFNKAVEMGADVVQPVGDYAWGAALKPDEDELKQFPVRYGRMRDPDGYPIEVVEPDVLEAMRNEAAVEPRINRIVLGVIDLDESVDFYTAQVGMHELRRRANINSIPRDASIISLMSFSDTESFNTQGIELNYKYATEKLDVGTGFQKITLVSADGDGGPPLASMRDPNGYLLGGEE